MAEPMKLNVLFSTYSYGGNGGLKSEHPDVRDWLLDAIPAAKADPRVGWVALKDYADTPITMTRNKSVVDARAAGADVLIMVDSDMSPDLYLGRDQHAKPFFKTAFDFLYSNWLRERYMVVAAPYGGPPPNECCYVFRWNTSGSDHPDDADMRLEAYTREQAAEMGGIQEAAALPTGLIMMAMPVFDLTEPKEKGDEPWFYYEWEDKYCSSKGSTEDVTFTRDVSLAGVTAWGYNPIHCAWGCWAGHWKPKCVGKPGIITADMVGEKFRKGVTHLPSDTKRIHFRSNVADTIDMAKVIRDAPATVVDERADLAQVIKAHCIPATLDVSVSQISNGEWH